MRFVHTADWQIGKSFRQFGERESVLRQARLTAIESIGQLAIRQGASHVLVAGDVYDTDAPTQRTLLEPLERMRQFPGVNWRLLPGNHDPHRPKGVWDRVLEAGAPGNVQVLLASEPAPLGPEAVLLPAPLTRKSEGRDLTEWMDGAATAPGLIRIAMAHGSVVGFGVGGEATNPVDPRRRALAGLAYLALGDWHRTQEIGPAVWYSGTPEPDRAGSQETGQALVVDIEGPGAPARVEPHSVGAFRWVTIEDHVSGTDELEDLELRLRQRPDLSSTIMRLRLSGSLPLSGRADLDRRLLGLEAAMFDLDFDDSTLSVQPTAADLERIDFGGVLRQAADRLNVRASDPQATPAERRRAGEALIQLYLMADGPMAGGPMAGGTGA